MIQRLKAFGAERQHRGSAVRIPVVVVLYRVATAAAVPQIQGRSLEVHTCSSSLITATCTAPTACTGKPTAYKESIRTPMILSGGQPRYNGWKVGKLPIVANHVDIAPTMLGLCHIAKPGWMMGTDLSHHRIGKQGSGPDPDSAYLQDVIPTGHPDSINTPYRGLVTKDGWKYLCFENRSWLMFNLNDDTYEESDLAQNSRYKAERKKMIARLKQ
jgi:arylsulfatase A-like enzyme